jgi:hypothetical protein
MERAYRKDQGELLRRLGSLGDRGGPVNGEENQADVGKVNCKTGEMCSFL